MSLIHYMFDESPSLFPRSAAAEQLMMMPVFMNDSCATKKRKPLCSLGNSHLDVIERDTKYEIFIDTPGLGPSDVKVAIEDGILSIEGKREEENKENAENGKVIYKERRRSSFVRKVSLPDNIDVSKVSAFQQNGVLNIHIEKKETSSGPKVIHVPVEQHGQENRKTDEANKETMEE